MTNLLKSFIDKPEGVCFDGEDPGEKVHYIFRKHPITNVRWILTSIVLSLIPFLLGYLNELSGVSFMGIAQLPTFHIVVITSLWYLFVLGYAFESFLVWFFHVNIVSNKRVVDIDFSGFLHRRFSDALLSNIEDVTHQISGVTQVAFHYGDVHIQTAGEYREISFECVPEPGKIHDLVSDLAEEVISDSE